MLRGGGPADVVELTVALAREMLALAGIDADPAAMLASGAAYPVWERMIAAQGGDPTAALPVASHVERVVADRYGVVGLDALAVGTAAWRLGAGRARKEDAVQAAAGVAACWWTRATRWRRASPCWSCTPTPRPRWRARAPRSWAA